MQSPGTVSPSGLLSVKCRREEARPAAIYRAKEKRNVKCSADQKGQSGAITVVITVLTTVLEGTFLIHLEDMWMWQN